MGEPDKAVQHLNRLMEKHPRSPYVKEAKHLLAKEAKDKKSASAKKTGGSKKKGTAPPPEEGPIVAKYDEEGKKAVSLTEQRPPVPEKDGSVPLLPVTGEDVKPIPPREGREGRREGPGATAPAEIRKTEEVPDRVKEAEKSALSAAAEPSKPIPGGEETKETRMEPPPAKEEIKVALIPGEEPPRSLSSPQPRVEKGTARGTEREKAMASLPGLLAPSGKKERPKREAPATPSAEGKPAEEVYPVDITSDSVETFAKDNLIVFKGNVLARQKDVVIYADSVQAYVIEDGKGIERVVASGNVKIQQGLRVASCQKAIFYNLDKKVVLTGNPKVWEGENIVSGDEIIFDIETNRVEVKGGASGRGKAHIIPQEEPKKKE
jgi:lipopolysaccharide export system protein LptA